MPPLGKIKQRIARAALMCLMMAVMLAPVTTTLQMLTLASAAASTQDIAMPCHGTQHADDRAASATGGCMCSPWCHAAVTTAFEVDLPATASDMPMAVAPQIVSKTADTPPHFKPPIA